MVHRQKFAMTARPPGQLVTVRQTVMAITIILGQSRLLVCWAMVLNLCFALVKVMLLGPLVILRPG